jgi:hypothetical protein
MQIARNRANGTLRQDALLALAETAGLFLIFIVAITGRDAFGDGVKLLLTIMSIAVGALGAAGGLLVARRGLADPTGRLGRFAIAGWMAFAGIYTIIHVLS